MVVTFSATLTVVNRLYSPHAKEKDCRGWIMLKVVKSLGTFPHGHIAGQGPVLEAVLR